MLRCIFGGADRIISLQRCLHTLKERSYKLRVFSFGSEVEINAALCHIGVDGAFDAVCGSTTWDRLGLQGHGNAKQEMLNTFFQCELGCSDLLFVDDDLGNFPQPSVAASTATARGQRGAAKFKQFDKFHVVAVDDQSYTESARHAAHLSTRLVST